MATIRRAVTKSFRVDRWLGLNEAPDGDTKLKYGEAVSARACVHGAGADGGDRTHGAKRGCFDRSGADRADGCDGAGGKLPL